MSELTFEDEQVEAAAPSRALAKHETISSESGAETNKQQASSSSSSNSNWKEAVLEKALEVAKTPMPPGKGALKQAMSSGSSKRSRTTFNRDPRVSRLKAKGWTTEVIDRQTVTGLPPGSKKSDTYWLHPVTKKRYRTVGEAVSAMK